MLALGTENTPLLPVVNIPHGHLPDLHHRETTWQRFISLPRLAFRQHWCGILTTIVSATVCWWLGYAEVSVIDDLIFKSIFIIFGFTMGFRNVRANQRYFDAMQNAQSYFSAFWGIYTVMPLSSRMKVRSKLTSAMKDTCGFIHRIGKHRQHSWYGIAGLEPTMDAASLAVMESSVKPLPTYGSSASAAVPRKQFSAEWTQNGDGSIGAWVAAQWAGGGIDEKSPESGDVDSTLLGVKAAISPHQQLLQALMDVEAELESIETDRSTQKFRRNFWSFKTQLLKSYDVLLSLAFPSVTDRFLSFIDTCLFFFAVSFPWGIKVKTLVIGSIGHRQYSIGSGLVLVVYTTMVVTVLFMLNAITSMNEDPIHGDCDDIDLRRLAHSVASGLEAFDRAGELAPASACGEAPGGPEEQGLGAGESSADAPAGASS